MRSVSTGIEQGGMFSQLTTAAMKQVMSEYDQMKNFLALISCGISVAVPSTMVDFTLRGATIKLEMLPR